VWPAANDDPDESRPENARIPPPFAIYRNFWLLTLPFHKQRSFFNNRPQAFSPMLTNRRHLMKSFVKGSIVLLFALIVSIQTAAAAPQWEVDPPHSSIYFSIQHIYSTVRGNFEDFKGTVRFDPDDLADSRFDFEVAVKSINTGNSKRDDHLNSGDFFDSAKYPKMTFKSTAVKHVADNRYVVEGTMTVKDVSETISVPFTLLGVKAHPMAEKSEVAGFEARMTIDRLAYHVGSGKFYGMGVVGKEVDVLISLEVMRKK
jgi:polyisoprenoid-binding protein YceI